MNSQSSFITQTEQSEREYQLSNKTLNKCLPSFLLENIRDSSDSLDEKDTQSPQDSKDTEGENDCSSDISDKLQLSHQKEKNQNTPIKRIIYSVDDIKKERDFCYYTYPYQSNGFNDNQNSYSSVNQMTNCYIGYNQMNNIITPIVHNGFNQYQGNYNIGYNSNIPSIVVVNKNSNVNMLESIPYSNIILQNPNGNYYQLGEVNSTFSTMNNNCYKVHINKNKSKEYSQSKQKNKNKKINNIKKISYSDNENYPIISLLSFSGKELFKYITTQKGSRDTQLILTKFNGNEIDILIAILFPFFSDVMVDKYGNYFIQILIQNSCPPQREKILQSIERKFIEIACDNFGTHPLQKLVEMANMPGEKEILLKYIEGKEIILSLDPRGNHVMQKFISNLPERERENINRNIINNISKLILDSFGVCVLIKLIKHSTNIKIKEQIAKYIASNNPLTFIQNPFSNYIVQSLLNENDIGLCEEIINVVKDNFVSLSIQKFSSNVVENCIKYCKEKVIKDLFNQLISQEKLGSFVNNAYGIFVVEKLIERLDKEEKKVLRMELLKNGRIKTQMSSLVNLFYI